MARVMMALGDYRFSLDTAAYQRLVRSTSYRWPEQERIGREPALQFLGEGREKVELSGTIYPQFRGGLGQMDRMRAEAGRGRGLMLVDGRGRVWGRYSIAQIEETQSVFFDDGVSRKVDFKLELRRYGDDAGAGTAEGSAIVQEVLERNAREVVDAIAAPAAVDMSGLMARSVEAAETPIPSASEMGIDEFTDTMLSDAGKVAAKVSGMTGDLAKAAGDALKAAGLLEIDAGEVVSGIASAGIRAVRGHGLPDLGSLPISEAASAFAKNTGLDVVDAALEQFPGSPIATAEGLYDMGVDAADFAQSVADNPAGAIAGVAKRLGRMGVAEAYRAAENLLPDAAGEVIAQASRDAEAFAAKMGVDPEDWVGSEPSPLLVPGVGAFR